MAKPTEAQKDLVKAMIDRMALAYGVDKKTLPEVIDIPKSTIANWSHYARIPHEQLAQCRNRTSTSLDWLMFGEQKAAAPEAMLTTEQVDGVIAKVQAMVEGAVDYSTIILRYPDSAEKMLEKLKNDLTKWQTQTSAPSIKPNGDNDS